MRDLDLTTLRLFVYVCESGSLVRASERANIVASAISKRLAQLEERLGTARRKAAKLLLEHLALSHSSA